MSEERLEELKQKIIDLKKNEEAIKNERLALEQQEEKERELKRQRLEQERQKREAEILAEKKRIEEQKARKKVKQLHLKANTKLLKDIFSSILSISNECKLIFKADGAEYRGVDPAHVIMKGMKLPVSMFQEYRLADSEHDMGISVDVMYSLLKRRAKGKGKIIELNQYLDNNDIFLSWESEYGGKFSRSVGTVDTAALPDPKIPMLDLPAKFEVLTNELLEFLYDAEEVSDHIAITASPKEVRFYASGDTDEIEYKPKLGGDYKVKKCYKSLFSIDYLLAAIKDAKPFFDTMILRIGTDNPLWMDGKITEDTLPMKLMILLAPRIESE